MNAKLQNILHWLLVIGLTVTAVEPAVNQVVTQGRLSGVDLVNAVVGVLTAAAIKFVYYADSVQGTTPPQV